MKTFRFFLLSLFFVFSAGLYAEEKDQLILNISKEVLGKTVKVDVEFDNAASSNYTAFQLDIYLPSTFNYVENSFKPEIRLLGHIASVATLPSNVLRVTAFSRSNTEISGNKGKIFSFILEANETAKRSSYRVRATKAVFTKRDGNEVLLPTTNKLFKFVPFDELKPYKITYLVDGQTYQEVTLLEGETIPPVKKPSKEGHTFVEWTDIPMDMPSHSISVSARFTVNSYSITYYLNGTLYGTQKVKYGEPVLPFEVIPADGETFLGWENVPQTMPAKDLIIYGKTEITGIEQMNEDTIVEVYNLQGIRLLGGVTLQKAKRQLPRGVYIVNGKLVYI